MTDFSENDDSDARLIAALLSCSTHEDAAKQADVSTATIRRRLAEPAFRKQLRAAGRKVIETAVARLQQAANAAVDALVRNLTCGKASDEIKAACAVLEHAAKGAELLDLAERLEAIESAMQEGQK